MVRTLESKILKREAPENRRSTMRKRVENEKGRARDKVNPEKGYSHVEEAYFHGLIADDVNNGNGNKNLKENEQWFNYGSC